MQEMWRFTHLGSQKNVKHNFQPCQLIRAFFQLWSLHHIFLKTKHKPVDHLPRLVLAARGADWLAAELDQHQERLLASVQPA